MIEDKIESAAKYGNFQVTIPLVEGMLLYEPELLAYFKDFDPLFVENEFVLRW